MNSDVTDRGTSGLLRALILSLLAAAVPIAGVFLFPASLQDYEALTWLLLLVPAFLWAYERGWRGIATSLAFGMALVSTTYVITQLAGATVPDLLLPVVVVYVAITLAIGVFGSRVARGGFDAAADMRALNDPATGLPNRTQAELHLELEFAAAQKGRPLTVVLFDIDQFSAYNARHGRTAGDAVLRGFASLVRQHTRRMDLGARHGGDEFMSILGGCVTEGAIIFATRLLERMRSAESLIAVPTVSAGIASYRPEMTSPAELVRDAEAALEQARRDGGDRVRVSGRELVAAPDADAEEAGEPTSPAEGPASEVATAGAAAQQEELEPIAIGLDDPGAAETAGRGRSAFLLTADPDARARLGTFLKTQGFQLIEGTALLDAFATLQGDFDLVFVDVAPRAPAVADLVREIRTRSPTTRVIGIPRTDGGALSPEALSIRVDAHYVPTTDVEALQRQMRELLAERDKLETTLIRHRQLSDEIRAKDRESREALEASERRYRSVVESIQEVIFATDANGALTFVNPAWTTITGFDTSESLGRSVYEFMHPDDRDDLLAQLAVALETDEAALRHEGRWRARDGATRWIEMRLQLDVGAAGLLATSGVLADATDRRAAESALRQSEEYFRSLIENSSDMMAIMNRDGTVRYVSPAVGRVLGTPPSQWIGVDVFDVGGDAEDSAKQRAAFERVVASPGSMRTTQARARHADGSWRHLEITWRNLLHVPGVDGIVVNARDITERQESEKALRHSEELLLRAQKMEAIGRLAGGVAHDFNNLLTAIQGHADLLLNEIPADGAIRPDLQEIRDAAERATSLTRQLLAFSRRQVMQPRVLEVNTVVHEMERMLRRLIGENIELMTELGTEAGCVRADPTQLEQVIMNLVVNARDAMPDGGAITVTTTRRTFERGDMLPSELSAGEYVVLTVKDTGAGMEPGVAAHVFEPFFTTKAPGEGTGLGLSTVYGIVKQTGGHVWLNSRPGDGSEFTILLPRVDEQADAPTPRSVASDGEHAGTETILLVEDEKSVRALARRILERRGYSVLVAADGSEALELASREGHIDLLLTDVIMPGLNGQDVAERVRALRPEIRVLFMSGYNEEAVLRHGELAAGTAFLEKPFSPSVLLDCVRTVLSEASRVT